jgi:hypothetical protein
MAACTEGRTVSVVADKKDDAAQICFSGLPGGFLAPKIDFPSRREELIAGLLGAQLAADAERGEISLTLCGRSRLGP